MARPQTTKRARRRRRPRWPVVALAAVVLAAAVGYFAYRAAANLPGVAFADQGNRHLVGEGEPHEPYNSTPPTSGPHLPYLAPWGVHTRPILPELEVHNLEDGGVLVQYNCECPALVARLLEVVGGYRERVILAPYPGMPHRIALTAWTRLDAFDAFDAARVRRFIEAYRGIDHHPR